jgi:hypothetical protein
MSIDPSRAFACAVLAVCTGAASAQSAGGSGGIYSCSDVDGKRIRSDRPIVGCVGEQVLHNNDGSLKRVIPRASTEEERAAEETRKRDAEAATRTRQTEDRADRGLLHRYPDRAHHDLDRKAALDSARAAIRGSETRIAELTRQRKPLLDEVEFYAGKPLPGKLKGALDANDAALGAQKSLIQNQQGEVVRIDKLYDEQLVRLNKLWGVKPAG